MKQIKHFLAFFITLTMIVSGGGLDGFAALSYAANDQNQAGTTQEQSNDPAAGADQAEFDTDIESDQDSEAAGESDQIVPDDDVPLEGMADGDADDFDDSGALFELSTKIKTADGSKWTITAVYGEEACIPGDAELVIEEIDQKDYTPYLKETAKTLKWQDTDQAAFARFFNISIVSKGKAVKPAADLEFTIKSKDVKKNIKTIQVVRFGDFLKDKENQKEKSKELACAVTKKDELIFATDKMAVFGFVTLDKDSLQKQTLKKGSVTLKGIMPGDAKLTATDATGTKEVKKLDKKGEITLAAYDISIKADGTEYQPDADHPIRVEIADKAIKEDSDLAIWHIKDNGEKEQIKDFETENGSVSFETDETAVYVVMETTLEKTVTASDGETYKVSVTYDSTAKLPSDTELDVTEITDKDKNYEKYLKKTAKYLDKKTDEITFSKFLDISLVSSEDPSVHYQPEADVDVSIKLIGEDKAVVKDLTVLHFAEDGIDNMGAVANGNTLSFKSDSFSIYPVTGETTRPRIFYTFYDGGTTLATEYITKIEDFYDPGVTPEYGQTFLGWAFDPAETDESNMLTFDQLTEDLTDRLHGQYEDETPVSVYAKFKEAYYLRYMVMEEDGTVRVIQSDSVRTDAPESDKIKTVNCDYSVAGEEFQGWIDAATGTLYENGQTLTLDHHIDLYAKITGRYWLVFNANTTGATFTGPQLIYGDITTQRPADPTKKGYLFKGWNTKSDGSGDWWYKPDGSVDEFGHKINKDTTLYAIWEGAPSNYTVAFWQQKLNTSGTNKETDYDFVTSESRESITDRLVSIDNSDKSKVLDSNDANYANHFVYNSENSDEDEVKVAGDGSTVLNVYYDRKEYTLRFFYAREYTVAIGGTTAYRDTGVDANNGYVTGLDTTKTYYRRNNNQYSELRWNNGRLQYSSNGWYWNYSGDVYEQYTQGGTNRTYIQVNSNNEGFLQWKNSNPNRTLEQALTWRSGNDYTNTSGSNTWKDVNNNDVNGNAENLISPEYLAKDEVSTGSININNVETDVCTSSSSSSVQNIDMTYHYIDLNVRYGQSLVDLWPAPDTTFVSQRETGYNRQDANQIIKPLLQGSRKTASNISGRYSKMDDSLLVDPADDFGYFLTYWRVSNPNYYLYRTYFSVLEGETADVTINGVGYKVQTDKTYVIANGQGWDRTNKTYSGYGYWDVDTVSFDGVTTTRRVDEQNSGTWNGQNYAGRINVYYERNPHKIHFVTPAPNTKYSSDNDHQVTNVAWGEDLSGYAPGESKYYETPADMINDGYFFGGWYDDKACTMPHDFSNQTMPDADVTVYAKIDTYRVRVVLEPNCTDYWFANNQALKFRVDYGESIAFGNIQPGVAKRPGYKLTGWYTSPDFRKDTEVDTDSPLVITQDTQGVNMQYQSTDDWRNNIYGDNDGEHGDVKGILKLYARWQLDIDVNAVYFLYEVEDGFCVFDASGNNQTSIPVDPEGHLFETPVQIAEAPSGYIDGVDFTNWMLLNKNGGATSLVYPPGHTIDDFTESEWADYIETKTVTDAEGNVGTMHVVRLRARFTAKQDKATTIVFDGNGGTMSGGATTYTEVVPLNATIELETQSSAFTREHHTLISWNTKADGTGDSFKVNEQIYADNVDLPNELYAVWLEDIEIVATGPEEEVIYDGDQHSNRKPYTFTYLLGGNVISEADLNERGIYVTIAETGWPVATGTDKGVYTSAALTDAQLEDLIRIDDRNYIEEPKRNIKRVYHPAKLTIRDLKLTITKSVSGEFSDPRDVFHFTIQSVEGMPDTSTFEGKITHKLEGGITKTKTFKIGQDDYFWLRDGDSVEIEGLPKDKQVIFVESSGFYTPTWRLNGEVVNTGNDPDTATITLTDDSTLEVSNYLPAVAPTAVTQRFMPYICMGLLALMLLAVMAMGRRRREWAPEGIDAFAVDMADDLDESPSENEEGPIEGQFMISFKDFDWSHIRVLKK